ncbi:nucleotidyltransferase family protein [Intrasporangium calvum]|uniref:nucleotidyltransferase family protein n=1 Tax=Intrasporangium calvum TaxID=53358 RepID=UPI001F19C3AD|nr:nucleotidyltransferase family protein [Intrasporangium calvum]
MSDLMPLDVGIRLTHASIQALAEDVGVDLLHIKGPTLHPDLLERVESPAGPEGALARTVPRRSSDADVLVRPSDLPILVRAMHAHGWVTKFDFEDGSAFEHAATMRHPQLALVDVHRAFPGIGVDPERAFDRLWVDRVETPIAGYPCHVPGLTAQRLILLLHAARMSAENLGDIRRSWTDATGPDQQAVEELARELGAEVALAAATGNLDRFRSRREQGLWAALSSGETSRRRLWWARVRAEPTPRRAVRRAVRLVVPNRRRMTEWLGRPPTRRELARAYAERIGWVLAESVSLVARRRIRGPR